MFFLSISIAFGMNISNDVPSLTTLSLQKIGEVAAGQLLDRGSFDFKSLFQRVPQDLRESIVNVIAQNCIPYLNIIFSFFPAVIMYKFEQDTEACFSALSKNAKFSLYLVICNRGFCHLELREANSKLLKSVVWETDETCVEFLSDSVFNVNDLWRLVPANFLIRTLVIARSDFN